MGSFLTNLQIHTAGNSPEKFQEALKEVLIKYVLQNSEYREAAEGEAADRTMVVCPGGKGTWITVYDEDTEDQDERKLDSLATTLSAQTGAACVSVLVHDSDVLLLGLFKNSEKIDSYNSNPGYFSEEIGGKKKKESKGNPSLWREVLADAAEENQLAKVFSKDKLFAEDILAELAALFGWHPDYCLMGYNYWQQSGLKDGLILRFCLKKRPVWEKKADGPSRFQLSSLPFHPSGGMTFSVGQPLDVRIGVRNTGGAAKGVKITVWGPGYQDGLVKPEKVFLWIFSKEPKQFTGILHEQLSDGGKKVLVAELPEFEVGAGPASILTSLKPGAYKDGERLHEFMVLLQGNIFTPGKTALSIGITPLTGSENIDCFCPLPLQITPASRLPLRYTEGKAPYEYLRYLEGKDILIGIAILKPGEINIPLLKESLEKWHHIISPDGNGEYQSILRTGFLNKAKQKSISAKKLLSGREWLDFGTTIGNCYEWTMFLAKAETNPLYRFKHNSGFAFLSDSLFFENAVQDRFAVHVCFWVDTASWKEADVLKAANELEAIINQMAAREKLMQAFVTQWAIAPGLGFSTNVYEIACGVHGQCTFGVNWCSRFLRAAAGRLWLGPELAKKVDMELLSNIAAITKIDAVSQIKLNSGASLDELERGIAPILAESRDWEEANRKLYEGKKR